MAGSSYGNPQAAPSLTAVPSSSAGGAAPLMGTNLSLQPHHGLVGLVLIAGLVIIVLDRAGFRFAVTAGKR